VRGKIIILLLLLLGYSCDLIKKSDEREPIARVNNTYLYQEDINGLVPEDASKQDSTLIIQNYIKRWATQQLFVDGAKLNLSEVKQQTFNRLVGQYKNDLYSKANIET